MARRNSRKLKKFELDFYASVGQAIAEWSTVEYALCLWFAEFLCKGDGALRASLYIVFNSARNFNTKRELLLSAIDANNRDTPLTKFIRAAITRTSSYSSFRNKIAHNLHAKNEQTKRLEIRSHDDIALKENPILKGDIDRAAKNFEKLASILIKVVARNGLAPSKGLQLIEKLPKEANLRRANPKPSKRAHRVPKTRKLKQS